MISVCEEAAVIWDRCNLGRGVKIVQAVDAWLDLAARHGSLEARVLGEGAVFLHGPDQCEVVAKSARSRLRSACARLTIVFHEHGVHPSTLSLYGGEAVARIETCHPPTTFRLTHSNHNGAPVFFRLEVR